MSLRPVLLVATLVGGLALSAASADAQGRRGLARTDTDRDGKISQQEFLAARGRIFEQMDADHDGTLTKDEVAAYRQRLENAAAGAMIRSGREGRGAEARGQRLAELTAAGPMTRAQWDALMTKRFERLDSGHLGYLTMDQMRGARRASVTAQADAPAMPAAKPQP
jgi:Ca2+-binding EF-hand superfamily protein